MSTSNIFWGLKAAGAELATLPPSCTYVLKFENLTLLQASKPLQTLRGISIYRRVGSSSASKIFL
jgi:hypothetical protein